MAGDPTFERLLAEGGSVPLEGWDFSWFEGRATEERPRWGYSRLLRERMARAAAALDIQTGGGEVLAGIPHPPPVLVATESWPPNIGVARRNLRPLGAAVVAAAGDEGLPFRGESFDLVVSRLHRGRLCRSAGTDALAHPLEWAIRFACPAIPDRGAQAALTRPTHDG